MAGAKQVYVTIGHRKTTMVCVSCKNCIRCISKQLGPSTSDRNDSIFSSKNPTWFICGWNHFVIQSPLILTSVGKITSQCSPCPFVKMTPQIDGWNAKNEPCKKTTVSLPPKNRKERNHLPTWLIFRAINLLLSSQGGFFSGWFDSKIRRSSGMVFFKSPHQKSGEFQYEPWLLLWGYSSSTVWPVCRTSFNKKIGSHELNTLPL